MASLYWLVGGLIALVGVLFVIKELGPALFGSSKQARERGSGLGYKKRQSVMNKSEAAFFYELQKQLPPGYHIFPKMRIADMLETVNGGGYYNRRNKILPKHIDFLVCDEYFKPVAALEVNGSSHNRADRIARDEDVGRILREAGLPLTFINVGSDFSSAIANVRTSLTG